MAALEAPHSVARPAAVGTFYFVAVCHGPTSGDRLGGRIHTHLPTRGEAGEQPLELGAQWLHGTVGNSLFDFCIEEGIFDSGGDEPKSMLLSSVLAPRRKGYFLERQVVCGFARLFCVQRS